MNKELMLIAVFIVSTIVGYFLIKNVPSLLHTPLMSGMNALSGVTVVGALFIVFGLYNVDNPTISIAVGGSAVAFAMVNVVGGFYVTDRMLKIFTKKGSRKNG